MSLLQAQHEPAASEIPERGCYDIVRPPRALVVNQQHATECVIDTALARKLLDEGGYARLPVPSVVVYRIQAGTHQQTGIVVEASIRDYREGRIRKHEATQPERERMLDISTAEAGFEQLPVTLTHTGGDELSSLLDGVTSDEPTVRVSTDDDHSHTVWVRDDADLVRAVRRELSRIDRLYIADGHHRIAAAERYASRRANPASAFTLAALFPSDQMRVLGYHRSMKRPQGYSTRELLATLAAQPGTADVRARRYQGQTPQAAREVTMRLDGDWYDLVLAAPDVDTDARDSLDAVTLDERVLSPLARASGLDPDGDIAPIPGGSGETFGRWCDEHRTIGFLPPPPSVRQVMAVSDAGHVLPPKSTWFDPKVSAGMFIRELS